MAKKSYDWVKLKLEFVKSSLSIRDFAEAFGVPFSTLSKKVMNEKWTDERKQIGNRLETKSIDKSVENRANELSRFEGKSLKAIEKTQTEIIQMLASCEKPSDLKSLSSALVDLQKVYRLALGASTENQAVQGSADFAEWVNDNGEHRSR